MKGNEILDNQFLDDEGDFHLTEKFSSALRSCANLVKVVTITSAVLLSISLISEISRIGNFYNDSFVPNYYSKFFLFNSVLIIIYYFSLFYLWRFSKYSKYFLDDPTTKNLNQALKQLFYFFLIMSIAAISSKVYHLIIN